MNDKITVLTGATGHVGYALLLELVSHGIRPRILIRKDSPIFDGIDCEKVYGDITDPESLEKAFDGAECVYHLAGMIEINKGNEGQVYRVNVDGTKNVVKACKKCGVKKLVYMSSVDTYPPLPDNQVMTEIYDYNPDGLEGAYAKTKAQATDYVLKSNGVDGLETIIVQPSACIGPYDFKVSSIGTMVRMYLRGTFNMSMSFGAYNFVDVRDVAKGTYLAMEKGTPGDVYILSGEVYTVDQFVKALAKARNKKPPKITLGKTLVCSVAAPVMEVFYSVTGGTPLITRYSMRKVQSNCNFSCEKARRELGYDPMSPEKSIADMMEWILENDKEFKDKPKYKK